LLALDEILPAIWPPSISSGPVSVFHLSTPAYPAVIVGVDEKVGRFNAPCGSIAYLILVDFFKYLVEQRPSFPTFATPIYSNNAFQILGYVLEKMTNRKFSSMLDKDIFQRLKMTHSSYQTPASTTFGVIPGDINATGWNVDFKGAGP
jgi:CubicO group peptidase (beta-lactamase class C family)